MEKNILITGGAGFIGSHLVNHHLKKNDQVWALDNLQTGQIKNLQPNLKHSSFRFDQADLCNWDRLQEAVSWAHRIYHMAASVGQRFVLSNPVGTLENNILTCEYLLQAMVDANSKARLLIASSSEVYCYCQAEDGFEEDTMLQFPSGKFRQESYALSKLINETAALSYTFEKGLHCTVVRIFNTIGINQSPSYGMVVPNFIDKALTQKPITVYGDGLQTRTFNNVHDTVESLDLLLDHPESRGKIFNVGNNQETSIIDLAKLIIKLTKSRSEIRFASYEEAFGFDFKDIRRRKPNLQKFTEITRFYPKWTLENTLEEIITAKEK